MLTEPEQYAQAALTAVSEGYDAIKVDTVAMDRHGNWNQQNLNGPLTDKILRTGYDRMAAIRDAVGPDVDIIAEMHAFTDTTSAIQFGRMIEELGIFYYEEPVMPLNPGQMKQVADKVNIPLAAGERIYWRWGYRPFPGKRQPERDSARYLHLRRHHRSEENLRYGARLRQNGANPRLRRADFHSGGAAYGNRDP